MRAGPATTAGTERAPLRPRPSGWPPPSPGRSPRSSARRSAGSSTARSTSTRRRPRSTPSSSTRASTWDRSPTMYRILREHDEVGDRRRHATHPARVKPELVATEAERGLQLGHHQAARPGEVDLLLPLHRSSTSTAATCPGGCWPEPSGPASPRPSWPRPSTSRASGAESSPSTRTGDRR